MPMPMTQNKPPRRIWAIVIWLIIIAGLIWLAGPRSASSQEALPPLAEAQDPVIVEVGPKTDRSPIDPFELYPAGMEFDVYRKGARVGRHKVEFERDGVQLKVTSHFKLKVKLLFITAYKFEFESIGLWKDGVLRSLTSATNDNGSESTVEAYLAEDGTFYSAGRKGTFEGDDWVYPSNHWNVGAVDSSVVLNTINGQLAKVEILGRGIENVETESGIVAAERFEYTGDLRDTTVWYDRDGRWVRMQFTTKQGETLEYVCKECGLPESSQQMSAAP
jgi:hypothetical protein